MYARLELGKLYANQGRISEADVLYKEILSIDSHDVHARLELGKLYANQGRITEAEVLYKEILSIDKKNVHARLELGKLYADMGKVELSSELYQCIINQLPDDYYDEDSRIKHLNKHFFNNQNKDIHGVFTISKEELFNIIDSCKEKNEYKNGYMCNVYLIYRPNCGYEGGKNGDKHILNYITIVTLPDCKTLITAFPSDNILEYNKVKSLKK